VGSGAVYTRWYSTICRAETCLFLWNVWRISTSLDDAKDRTPKQLAWLRRET
jgi:hypothetical protein